MPRADAYRFGLGFGFGALYPGTSKRYSGDVKPSTLEPRPGFKG